MDDKCIWKYDNWNNFFDTSCKKGFQVNEGSLTENDFNYCPFCGLEIEEE